MSVVLIALIVKTNGVVCSLPSSSQQWKSAMQNTMCWSKCYQSSYPLKLRECGAQWLKSSTIKVIFSFRSNDLDLFTANIASSLGGFVQMLNNYCFPDVKCLLECWQFMDHFQPNYVRHYLHFRFNFHSNHSNPNYLPVKEKIGH